MSSEISNEHYSVLLKESVDALITSSSGVYVDCTFGRGGHSGEILKRLSVSGSLIGFDKDPDAIAAGELLSEKYTNFSIVHSSFANLSECIGARDLNGRLNGVLMDLGVSSPQLDNAERGFSFMQDGPLDMRMNNQSGISARDWIAYAAEDELAGVFKKYGEERFSKRIARAIVSAREEQEIESTLKLAEIVKQAHPAWEKGKHPATRVFQAIRIFINSELDDLERALEQSVDALEKGGRLVVISFHSLEDRIVKQFFKRMAQGRVFPKNIPVTEDMLDKRLKLVGKAVKASSHELDENIRSRSAVMRVAERI